MHAPPSWQSISSSQPSRGSELQSPKPVLQPSTVHSPDTQPASPSATTQVRPHIPQLSGSFCRSLQPPSHAVSGALHSSGALDVVAAAPPPPPAPEVPT